MIPTIYPSGQQFLDSLNNIQSRISTAEQQLSSGLKISQPSDAPDEISPILQLYSQIQQNQDIQTNLGTVQTQVNAGQNALSSAVDLLQNASVIATQATSLNQTADTRATLAQNVQGILEQMVAISNTTVAGRYVFSGDQDQTSLYTLDLNSLNGNGVDRAQVATNTGLVQGPGGAQFSASLSAKIGRAHV
jgi:flagellar hook-associated protein 3 FlgL